MTQRRIAGGVAIENGNHSGESIEKNAAGFSGENTSNDNSNNKQNGQNSHNTQTGSNTGNTDALTKESLQETRSTSLNNPSSISTTGTTDLVIAISGPAEAGHYENFEYIITASNNGPDDADNTSFTINAFSGAENLTVTCETIIGNAVCPQETDIQIQETTIKTQIPTFTNNSSVKFRVMGRYMYIPPTSVNMQANITVPDGMSELNAETNFTETNTKLNILPADLEIESEIKSTLQVTHKEIEAGNYAETLFFDDNGKIIQRTTITNHGPGIVKNVPILLGFEVGINNHHNVHGQYHDLKITCSAQNGAECPTNIITTSSGTMYSYSRYFGLYDSWSDKNQPIPFLPVGSSVTFEAEVKFSKMFHNVGGTCGDETLPIKINKNYTYIAGHSLRDPNSSNNSIENNPDILIGETEKKPCNKIDIRVTEYTNSHSGSIATTPIYPSGKTMPDLIVDNPEEITYTVAWTNSGADTTNPVSISNNFDISDRYWMHYKNVHISCEAIGMHCPEESELNGENSTNFTSSLIRGNNEEQAIFIKTAGDERPYTHHPLISYNTHFPAGANIKFTIKITPTKFTPDRNNNDDEKCGTTKSLIDLELKGVYFFINDHANQREITSHINTFKRIYLHSIPFPDNYLYTPIKQVGVTQFGEANRKHCPETDLAISDIKGFSGYLDGHVVYNPAIFASEFIVDNPKELSFSVVHTNSGSHHANNSKISWKNISNYDYNWGTPIKVDVFDVKLECEGINMNCPDINNPKHSIMEAIKNGEGTLSFNRSARHHESFYIHVTDWPAGGSLKYTLKFKVKKIYAAHKGCSLTPQIFPSNLHLHFGHTSRVNNNIIDINDKNGGHSIDYGVFYENDKFGWNNIDGVGQKHCDTGDLSVQVENSTDLMEFNNTFTQTITYRNNGESVMENSEIFNYWISLRDVQDTIGVLYNNYSISCETTNGAICPEKKDMFSEFKHAGNRGGWFTQNESGTQNFSSSNEYHADNRLFHYWTTIPSMPPGSAVKFTIQYKNKKPLQPELPNCGMNEKLAWSNGHAKIQANRTQYQESNISNNNSDYTINNYYCIDLWSNTSLDKVKPTPNGPLTMSIRIGNAGQATATGTLFSTVIPAGFTNFDPNTIQCQASHGSPCAIPSFDPSTRTLSSTIETIKKDEIITYTIAGQAIDYSSSWETKSVLTEGKGMFERIPTTNTETFSFVVEGVDPTVTKIANIHEAESGDEVLYTITVKNPKHGSRLVQSRIEDILPHAFEYISTERISMQEGSINTSGNTQNPNIEFLTNGETKISWGNFTIPSGGNIVIQFKVRVKEHIQCQATPFHNSATLFYTIEGTGIHDSRSYQGNLIGLDQDDITILCAPIDAKEDFLMTDWNTGTNSLSHTSLSLIDNDSFNNAAITMNGDNSSFQDITFEEVDINNFITQNSKGETILNNETYNLFSGSLTGNASKYPQNFLINTHLTGKSFDTNRGVLSWSNTAYKGNYLFAYKICDKGNALNCDIVPVLLIITRDPQSATIIAQDDIENYTRNEDTSISKQTITIFSNDSYILPNDTTTSHIPHKDTVTVRLDTPADGGYAIDTTSREKNGEKVIATIITNNSSSPLSLTPHPLIGAYLTENGNFVIPENTAPEGEYVFPYTICTKLNNINVTNSCASANIRVKIMVNTIAKEGTITPQDDSIFQKRKQGKQTSTTKIALLVNDTFTTPNDPGIQQEATIKDTIITLKSINTGSSNDYDVDITPKIIDGQTILGSITGNHPLRGSYLTKNGEFIIPPHEANPGNYTFVYNLCTKEVAGSTLAICADAYIRIHVGVFDTHIPETIPGSPKFIPDITVDAENDIIRLHRKWNENTPETHIFILKNDIIHHELMGQTGATIENSMVNIKPGNNIFTGSIFQGGEDFYIPSGKYTEGIYTIPYTLCTNKEDNTPVCGMAEIQIHITVDTPPSSTPNNPGTGGGGGGNGNTPPVNHFLPPASIPPVIPEEPLFSAPMIHGKCVSAVKNLDDPKLLTYYDILKVQDKSNVHRTISRIEFIKLVLHAAQVDLSQEDISYLSSFSDVDTNMWYAPYIAYMIRTETMHGQEIEDENGDTIKVFRPNDGITRAEASKILSELTRSNDQKLPSIEEIITFADIDKTKPLSPYIQYAYNKCLLHGRKTINGEPFPGKPRIFEGWDGITLAETAKVLYNIIYYTEGNIIGNSFEKIFSQSLFHQYIQRMKNNDKQKNQEVNIKVSNTNLQPILSIGDNSIFLQDMLMQNGKNKN